MHSVDDLTIRDAGAGDLPRLVVIYNEAIPGRRATADTEPVTLAARQDWFRAHGPDPHPIWVGERGMGVVGRLSFQLFYVRPAYAATAELRGWPT